MVLRFSRNWCETLDLSCRFYLESFTHDGLRLRFLFRDFTSLFDRVSDNFNSMKGNLLFCYLFFSGVFSCVVLHSYSADAAARRVNRARGLTHQHDEFRSLPSSGHPYCSYNKRSLVFLSVGQSFSTLISLCIDIFIECLCACI
jgi:hypothetical protein